MGGFTGVSAAQQAAGYNSQEFGLKIGPNNQSTNAMATNSGPNVQKKTWSQTPSTGFVPTEHHGPILDPASTNTKGACQFGICTDLASPASKTPYKDEELGF